MEPKVLVRGRGKEWHIDIVEIDGEPRAVPSERWKRAIMRPALLCATPTTQQLWRYMSLTKFIALLDQRALWFSRSDLFGDPFEGSYTAPIKLNEVIHKTFGEEGQTKLIQSYSEHRRNFRTHHYISCWHKHHHENMAMWANYGSSNESVAVQTTVADLLKLKLDRLEICGREFLPRLYLSEVKYIDFIAETIDDGDLPFLYKNLDFRTEEEYRAISYLWTYGAGYNGPTPPGFNVTINPSKFIKQVVTAPNASNLFKEIVGKICQKYSLRSSVRNSSLDRSPIF